MSSTTLAPRSHETEEFRPNQTELWRRYSKDGAGSTIENRLVEQYLPLVKTVVDEAFAIVKICESLLPSWFASPA